MITACTASATVGPARFHASGPAEVVFAQFARFIRSLTMVAPDDRPPTPCACVLQRFVTVGVANALPPERTPAARFLERWVTG